MANINLYIKIKSKNKNIIKLANFSGVNTYCFTLPIGAIKEFGWHEKQELVIEVDNKNKRIIIKNYKD